MFNWLKRQETKPEETTTSDTAAAERELGLEREVQGLRLELQEKERAAAQLKAELDRQRAGEETRRREAVQAATERLLGELAGAVAQLATQDHLLKQGKPVHSKDVLAVARRVVRTLEQEGLSLEGTIGGTVAFDPDLHEPLAADCVPAAGDPALLRFVGASYQGKRLRKAGVEKVVVAEEQPPDPATSA